MKYLIILGILLISFISCDTRDYIFQHTKTFDREYWLAGDSASFQFEIKDTGRYYNLFLDLDHGKNYPYENLYLKFRTTFPNSNSVEDQLSLQLADETGDWYSDCRGKSCTLHINLQDQVIFSQKGKYQLTILPWMRMDTIPGMYRLNFMLERDGKR